MQHTNLISATIIADSMAPRGDRLTTYKLVFPRFILAELNTHRVFSKNSASSRAIPFRKMVKSALANPFIPMAFQKEHSGMQGTHYLDPNKYYSLSDFVSILKNVFKYTEEEIEFQNDNTDTLAMMVSEILGDDIGIEQTLQDWWLYCRDQAVKSAIMMSALGVTKQLCNRILEPFLYHTVLLTATEYYNFFKLRCPKYEIDLTPDNSEVAVGKSWRELMEWRGINGIWAGDFETDNTVERLSYNKGAGEIHIMDLAEKMYDALNESTPEQLKEGQWHIPYGDNIDLDGTKWEFLGNVWGKDMLPEMIKVATARMARISYETLGDDPKIDYKADIKLHDDLLKLQHMSPFEHCARAMTSREYDEYLKGRINDRRNIGDLTRAQVKELGGWSRNFRGFVQYRDILES